MFRYFKINFLYTTEHLAEIRNNYSKQTCFRSQLNWLKFKKTLTNSLSNRLVFNSQFYRSYLNTRHYYTKLLRANFCKKTSKTNQIYKLTNFDNRAYKLAYYQYQSFKDFDNALLWRASQINSLFSLRQSITKKRKKLFIKQHVHFIPVEKRLLFVWKWLTMTIKAVTVKKTPRHYALIAGFENFLAAPKETHLVTIFKFKIYKLHAVRNI